MPVDSWPKGAGVPRSWPQLRSLAGRPGRDVPHFIRCRRSHTFDPAGQRTGGQAQAALAAGLTIALELADGPDRRLGHAAAELAAAEAAAPGTHVTVVLPRRSYPPLTGRLLHDHTADRIARRVSRVPGAAATIIPFDVRHKV